MALHCVGMDTDLNFGYSFSRSNLLLDAGSTACGRSNTFISYREFISYGYMNGCSRVVLQTVADRMPELQGVKKPLASPIRQNNNFLMNRCIMISLCLLPSCHVDNSNRQVRVPKLNTRLTFRRSKFRMIVNVRVQKTVCTIWSVCLGCCWSCLIDHLLHVLFLEFQQSRGTRAGSQTPQKKEAEESESTRSENRDRYRGKVI